MCTCVHTCVCTPMEINLDVIPLGMLSSFIFSLSWNLPVKLGWPDEPQGSSCPCLPVAEITSTHTTPEFFLMAEGLTYPDWQGKTRERRQLVSCCSPLRDHCGYLWYEVHILVDTAILLITTVDSGVNIQNHIYKVVH